MVLKRVLGLALGLMALTGCQVFNEPSPDEPEWQTVGETELIDSDFGLLSKRQLMFAELLKKECLSLEKDSRFRAQFLNLKANYLY